MHRHRLKGGHKVGYNPNAGSGSFYPSMTASTDRNFQVSEQSNQSQNKSSMRNEGCDGSWGWGSTSNPMVPSQQVNHKIGTGIQEKSVMPDESYLNPSINNQSNTMFVNNNVPSNNQPTDEWGWNTDENWEDWGNNGEPPSAQKESQYYPGYQQVNQENLLESYANPFMHSENKAGLNTDSQSQGYIEKLDVSIASQLVDQQYPSSESNIRQTSNQSIMSPNYYDSQNSANVDCTHQLSQVKNKGNLDENEVLEEWKWGEEDDWNSNFKTSDMNVIDSNEVQEDKHSYHESTSTNQIGINQVYYEDGAHMQMLQDQERQIHTDQEHQMQNDQERQLQMQNDQEHQIHSDQGRQMQNDQERQMEIQNDRERQMQIQNDRERQMQIQNDQESQMQIQNDQESQMQIQNDQERQMQIQNDQERQMQIQNDQESQMQIQNDQERQMQIQNDQERQMQIQNDQEIQMQIQNDKEHQLQIQNDQKRQMQIQNDQESQMQIQNDQESQMQIQNDQERQMQIQNDQKRQMQIQNDQESQMQIQNDQERQMQIQNDQERQMQIQNDQERQMQIQNDQEHQMQTNQEYQMQMQSDQVHQMHMYNDQERQIQTPNKQEHHMQAYYGDINSHQELHMHTYNDQEHNALMQGNQGHPVQNFDQERHEHKHSVQESYDTTGNEQKSNMLAYTEQEPNKMKRHRKSISSDSDDQQSKLLNYDEDLDLNPVDRLLENEKNWMQYKHLQTKVEDSLEQCTNDIQQTDEQSFNVVHHLNKNVSNQEAPSEDHKSGESHKLEKTDMTFNGEGGDLYVTNLTKHDVRHHDQPNGATFWFQEPVHTQTYCSESNAASQELSYCNSFDNKQAIEAKAQNPLHVNMPQQHSNISEHPGADYTKCKSDQVSDEGCWDEDWGDGWEKQSQNMDIDSSLAKEVEKCSINESHTNRTIANSDLIEKVDSSCTSSLENMADVASIEVLDKELQEIFSIDSTTERLSFSLDLKTPETEDAPQTIKSEAITSSGDFMSHVDQPQQYLQMPAESTSKNGVSDDSSSKNYPKRESVISQQTTHESSHPPSNFLTGHSMQPSNLSATTQAFERSESELYNAEFERNPTVEASAIAPPVVIPTFQSRKGSPFQPLPKKQSMHQQKFNPSQIAMDNSILANSEPPKQNVKLSVASAPVKQQKVENKQLQPNSVPLVVSDAELTKNVMQHSNSKNRTNQAMRPDSLNNLQSALDQIDPPLAHLSSLQSKVQHPKIRTLDSVMTPSSPGVLDLSQIKHIKKEKDIIPDFHRMVPGESTKGKSSATVPHVLHTAVPAMPSERVVTGNANPQPIPTARIKQEANEVRSPPDGPDTACRVVSHGSSVVVPPIRSETIGSEDLETRPLPISDRRDALDSRKERDAWDRSYSHRDPCDDRKFERSRYRRDDSPHNNRRTYDEYEPRYRDRRNRLKDSDDEDEDHEHARYAARDRRDRTYRDEVHRYGDMESRHRRRTDYHEEDDPYFESRSGRSRPTSPYSNYSNHEERHPQEYYDRSHRKRESQLGDRNQDFRRDSRKKGPKSDPFMRGYPNQEHFGGRDMYDPNMYYYYQKMWEQYPSYYRDYYRQYYGRSAYSTAGESMIDDKASTRSGRSSVNDDMKKSSMSSMAPYDPYGAYYGTQNPANSSSHFRQDFLNHSALGALEPSAVYPGYGSTYGQMKSYPSGEISGIPSVTDEAGSEPNQRSSPLFFNGPHLAVKFTPGGKLLMILPNDPKEGERARVQIRNVQKMLSIDDTIANRIQKMKNYPGPLTVKETHKDAVIKFCLQKALEATEDKNLFDRESVVLFWEYLSLLVKQNGKVCGVDLANLMLKDKELDLPAVIPEPEEEGAVDESSPQDEGIDVTVPELAEHVQTFTQYLCLGRKREAVDFAMKEGLWGHAMTLASKMDSAVLARVMTAFMNSIPKTDVLHTLVQHLSGKKPEVSKNYSTERWGDWRHHLSIIVSNPTNNYQRDRASVIALGDMLASKGRTHASHLCYLAAEAEWGTYSNKDSKIVLIGSSHHQPFNTFTSEESIQCTEIYEFAKSQDLLHPTLNHFQSYKLIYALRLTECGFPYEALRYCEVISQAVLKDTNTFTSDFVSQVVDLASQLKYHDVHYQLCEGEVSEMTDPAWLQSLQSALYDLQCQQVALAEENVAPVEEQIDASKSEPTLPPIVNYGFSDQSSYPPNSLTLHDQATNETNQNYSYNHDQQLHPPQENIKEEISDSSLAYYSPEQDHQNFGVETLSAEVPVVETMQIPSPSAMEYQEIQHQHSSAEWNQPQRQNQPPMESSSHWNQDPSKMSHNQPPMESSGHWNQDPSKMSHNQPHLGWHQPEASNQDQWNENTQEFNNDQKDSHSLPNDISESAALKRTEEEQQYWAMMSGKAKENKKSLMESSSDKGSSKKVTFKSSSSAATSLVQSNPRRQFLQHQEMLLDDSIIDHEDYERGITKSNLVFGGSFPIDAPISARQLGTTQHRRQPKTYQIDSICCTPPNLCSDHRDQNLLSRAHPVELKKQSQLEKSPIVSHQQMDCSSLEDLPEELHSEEQEALETYPVDDEILEHGYDLKENLDDDDFEYQDDEDIQEESENEDFEGGKGVSSVCLQSAPPILCPQTYSYSENTNRSGLVERRVTSSIPKGIGGNGISSNQDICPQPAKTKEQSKACTEFANIAEQITALRPVLNVKGEKTDNQTQDNAPPKTESSSAPEADKEKTEAKNAGFFGSIFSWKKKSNQATLPDDKSPTIIWDETKKKWINTDGDNEESAPPLPPPVEMARPIPSFRGGNKKFRYVDLVGDKSRTKGMTSPPMMPPIPSISPAAMTPHLMEPTSFGTPEHPMNESVSAIPPRMNRNRFQSESSSVDLSEDCDRSQGVLENAGSVPMMPAGGTQGQPQFLNPAQVRPANAVSQQPKRMGPSRRAFNNSSR